MEMGVVGGCGPLEQQTQTLFPCTWFIFLICLKKYEEKYTKSFRSGLNVHLWDGAAPSTGTWERRALA